MQRTNEECKMDAKKKLRCREKKKEERCNTKKTIKKETRKKCYKRKSSFSSRVKMQYQETEGEEFAGFSFFL